LSKETKDLTRQLKILNESIDTLTKVTAISIGKEAIFQGKSTIEEKIAVLDKMGLSNELIAIITGSKSAHSVSQIKSNKKPKTSTKQSEALKEQSPNEVKRIEPN